MSKLPFLALQASEDKQTKSISPIKETRYRSVSDVVDNSLNYKTSLQSRQPINSPAPEARHKDYNRLKYYSKLRTAHIGQISFNQSESSYRQQQLPSQLDDSFVSKPYDVAEFLRPPSHVIDQQLFVLRLPFVKERKYSLVFFVQ